VSGPPVEYEALREIRGPLMVVEGVAGVGWDEVAEIRLGDGELRHGIVLEVHDDLAVVEVLESTAGMRIDACRVSFTGSPMRIPVSAAWLGRACDGRGRPLDGGPPIVADEQREIAGRPINPARRAVPAEPILTGVSAIDGLVSLVRGQKLPIFSIGGLPHLELAAQVAAQASAGGEPFAVVFAAMGLTNADAAAVRDTLEARAEQGDLALLVNTAEDPTIERIVTPRIALTIAEHLAFDLGRHVLVVMADLTSYGEALREVSAARGEIPSRRGYPGYLYSDLASLLERAGRIEGRVGSITQLPALTMPAGDITHPVADMTGYITEGQILLSAEVDRRGIYPPLDPLGSLSRLMRLGAGPGRTRDDHLDLAAQLYALVARARRVADLAEVIGEDALSEAERRFLGFSRAFERDFLAQGRGEERTLDETLDRGWAVASRLPASELTMIPAAMLEAHYRRDATDPTR
jgi:V/A-type H+-transporting ATPase subunit B